MIALKNSPCWPNDYPARSSSASHHCASPKGEDQHFKLLFLFILSKPHCREAFSLRIEGDRRQTGNNSTLAIGNRVKQSLRCCLTQYAVKTIQPICRKAIHSPFWRGPLWLQTSVLCLAQSEYRPPPWLLWLSHKLKGHQALWIKGYCDLKTPRVPRAGLNKDAYSSTLTYSTKGILPLQKTDER